MSQLLYSIYSTSLRATCAGWQQFHPNASPYPWVGQAWTSALSQLETVILATPMPGLATPEANILLPKYLLHLRLLS